MSLLPASASLLHGSTMLGRGEHDAHPLPPPGRDGTRPPDDTEGLVGLG